MAYDAEAYDLAAETDAVIHSFGLPPTRNNLASIAEEMERRARIYPGGLLRADRVIRELQRRALVATSAWRPRSDAALRGLR